MEGLRLPGGVPAIGTTGIGLNRANISSSQVDCLPQLPRRNLLARCNGMVVGDGAAVVVVAEERSESWMDSILQVPSAPEVVEEDGDGCSCCDHDVDSDYEDDDEKDGERMEFDSNLFSRFLRRVNLSDAKMFAQLSYLSMLAYCIPKIKACCNLCLTFASYVCLIASVRLFKENALLALLNVFHVVDL